MKKIIYLLPMILFVIMSCTSSIELKKSKNRWIIKENSDIKVTLNNNDIFEFQKGDFRIFNDKQVLKGIGLKLGEDDLINKVVIPLKDIKAVSYERHRNFNYYVTGGIVVAIGVGVYLILK